MVNTRESTTTEGTRLLDLTEYGWPKNLQQLTDSGHDLNIEVSLELVKEMDRWGGIARDEWRQAVGQLFAKIGIANTILADAAKSEEKIPVSTIELGIYDPDRGGKLRPFSPIDLEDRQSMHAPHPPSLDRLVLVTEVPE